MSFFRLVRYDVRIGIIKRFYQYAICFLMVSAFVIGLYYVALKRDMFSAKDITFINALLYIFQGKDPFDPSSDNAFVFPIVWLLFFIYELYVVLDYSMGNMLGHGTQVLIRTGARFRWWISKCIWVFACTFLYFLISYLSVLFVIFFAGGGLSFGYSEHINTELLDMELFDLNGSGIFILLFLMPLLTALAMNFVQLICTLFFKETYSFLISVALLFASSYYRFPWLIGNFAMVRRSHLYYEDGFLIETEIIIDAVVILISILAGGYIMKRIDIIRK